MEIKPPFNGWRWSKETLEEKMATGEIRFNEDYTSIKRRTYLYEQKGLPPSSLWAELEETGHTRQAKYEQKKLFPEMNKNTWFATPKPEKLIERVLTLATNPGDLVLDSFLGSGTTAAVAQIFCFSRKERQNDKRDKNTVASGFLCGGKVGINRKQG